MKNIVCENSLVIKTALIFMIGIGGTFALPISISNAGQTTAQIRGCVTDIMGAKVMNAAVVVEGKSGAYTVKTNESGEYLLRISPGLYRIEVDSFGFCKARRAPFEVGSNANATFDFTLSVCPIVNKFIIENGKHKEVCVLEPPFKTEVFPIRTSSGRSLDLMIEFGKYLEDKNAVEYIGYHSEITYSLDGTTRKNQVLTRVVASYDLLTIRADKIRFDRESLQLTAEGQVTLQDDKRRVEGNRVKVDLKSDPPIITVN